jgi:hypothetical protein
MNLPGLPVHPPKIKLTLLSLTNSLELPVETINIHDAKTQL